MNNFDEKNETVGQSAADSDLNAHASPLTDLSEHSENSQSTLSLASEQINALNEKDNHQGSPLDLAVGTIKSNMNNTSDMISSTACEGVGNILRNARTAKGMSIEEVSRQLRLSVQQIDAIEREDFDKLPGRTFLRGFIRNYANLLQLDPSLLLKMLPVSVRILSATENTPFRDKQISFSSDRKKKHNYSLPMVTILSIFILSAYFFFGNRNQQDEEITVSTNKEAPSAKLGSTTKEIRLPVTGVAKNSLEGTTSQPVGTVSTNSASVAVELDLTSAVAAVETKPATQSMDAMVVSADPDTGNLQFRFNGDSWIRVVDGGGSILLEQTMKAGSEQTVTGKKPFTVIIGNASAVNLTYNDREIDVSSHTKQGGVARFKLE